MAGKSEASVKPSLVAFAAAEFRRSLAEKMNNDEARKILAAKLKEYRTLTYKQLVEKAEQRSDRYEVSGPSGVRYQVVINMFWDDKPGEIVRVFGCIDDSGWRAFFPLTDSFLVALDGSFVGE